jgi:hypothetical protein
MIILKIPLWIWSYWSHRENEDWCNLTICITIALFCCDVGMPKRVFIFKFCILHRHGIFFCKKDYLCDLKYVLFVERINHLESTDCWIQSGLVLAFVANIWRSMEVIFAKSTFWNMKKKHSNLWDKLTKTNPFHKGF